MTNTKMNALTIYFFHLGLSIFFNWGYTVPLFHLKILLTGSGAV